MTESSSPPPGDQPEVVHDYTGRVHILVQPPLGEGGQGRVYRTSDPEVLVKFGCRNGRIICDAQEHDQYRSRFASLLELDLAGIDIAAPETLLKSPYCGYSMRLVRDMVPIKTLLLPGNADLDPADYVKSGGLRRRLEVLTNLAHILSRIHSIPAAYGDISPENIFISASNDRSRVHVIDADNMHVLGRQGFGCYTPGYAAPELATHGHSDSRSDVFGFACLAYNILCQHEAFNRGSEVAAGGGWDCSTAASKEAPSDQAWLAAGVPWVHDAVAPCEAPGVPWDLVCSPRMQQLFQDTLGGGRPDPDRRPSMRRWQSVLSQARDALIRCPQCGWDYFVNCTACPAPGCRAARPPFVKWEIRLWHPDLDAGWDDPGLALGSPVGVQGVEAYLAQSDRHIPADTPPPVPPWGFVVQQVDDGASASVMTRHCLSLCERDIDRAEFQVRRVGDRLRLDVVSDRFVFHVVDEANQQKSLVGSQDQPLPGERNTRWWIHTGPVDAMHRVLYPIWHPAVDGGKSP